jgi:hypothetical protein
MSVTTKKLKPYILSNSSIRSELKVALFKKSRILKVFLITDYYVRTTIVE